MVTLKKVLSGEVKMEIILVVQNNNNPNECWEKSFYFPSDALPPLHYEICAPMGEKFPYFKIDKGIIFIDTPTGNISLKLAHLVNPRILVKMELEKFGWKKIDNCHSER